MSVNSNGDCTGEHMMNDHIESYWHTYFEGYSPITFPCLTGLRPEVASGLIESALLKSSISLSELQTETRSCNSSPLAAVEAAWGSILHAYSGCKDIAFGSALVGCYKNVSEFHIATTKINLFPVRFQNSSPGMGASCTNADFLRKLTEDHIKTSKRPYLQAGSTSGKGNKHPFDTAILLQSRAANELEHCDGQVTDSPSDTFNVAVVIEILVDVDQLLMFKVAYTDNHLDRKSAMMMLEQLDGILKWILSNPAGDFENAFSHLNPSLQSSLNPRPLLDSAQISDLPFVHSQFEIHAETSPDDIALIFINDLYNKSLLNLQWTYAMLNDKATCLAGYLMASFGPLAGTPIPIYMEKSPYLYVAILGIVKAGGAWCPIDTLSPANRRRELIARTGARILLAAQASSKIDSKSLPEGVTVVDVTNIKTASPSYEPSASTTSRETPAQSSDMAYLIWTSGTTGPPKGVSISHEAAVTSMKALQSQIPSKTRHGGPIRCMQFSQHTFDVFVQDCFYTWGLGGVLISSTKEIMISDFTQLANSTTATHAHLTPAFAAGISRASCDTLETITMIGEKLPQHVADDWGRDMLAYNTYGPAEVTVVATVKQFGDDEKSVKSSNIGFPLPSVSCYVLKGDQLMMINGVGELALGGYQLAKGYWRDPHKTSERFVWNGILGKDLYMTGDIVRQLANGTLEFIGREDDLVKIGGIRVELSEISYALRQCHSSVGQIETFYIGRSDRPAKVIVSFVAASGLEIAPSDHGILLTSTHSAEIARVVLEAGHSSLPEYMAPNIIVVVKRIPRTPSAKVDRKALLNAYESLDLGAWELKMNLRSTNREIQTSFTEPEIAVLEIVSSISGVALQSMNRTSFLPALGIDSLLSGRLASEVKKIGCKVSLEEVLRSRTIQDLLQLTRSNQNRTINYEVAGFDAPKFHDQWSPLVRKTLGRNNIFILPASTLQDSLISESLANHKSYWSNHFFDLSSHTNLEQLRAAWKRVQRQNQAMRTGFYSVAEVDQTTQSPECNSNFLQLIYDEADIDYRHVHVQERNCKEGVTAYAFEITQRHHQAAFLDPPWAIRIIDHRGNFRMMLSIHHAIHDDTSLGFIVNDVWDAYKELGKATTQRCQLRDAMAVMLASDTGDCQASKIWFEKLKQFADPDAPMWPDLTGRPESLKENNERALTSVEYKMQILEQDLQHFLQMQAVTPIQLIRAAFGCLLLDYLETDMVVFGETISERVFHPDFADAIAPMLSIVPIPVRRQESGLDMLRELDKVISLARSHRRVPAIVIKELLKRSHHQSLYPAIFSYNPAELQYELEGGGDTWHKSEDLIGLSVEHPLALNVTKNGGWSLELFADGAFMNQGHLQVFASQIDALVQAMTRSPQAPISGLLDAYSGKVLSMTQSYLPDSTNHLPMSYPTYWVEHYAGIHPEWIAVEVTNEINKDRLKTQSWTFAKLEEESNRIATYICNTGNQGRIIAMCAGRTLASYAIILGILKSGNTYLPIDESLPSERKLLLLTDSQCIMLFTDSRCLQFFDSIPDTCFIANLDNHLTAKAVSSLSPKRRPNVVSPESSAYLLYTSGSTGKPKGVLISYKNLCGFVEGLSAFMGDFLPATHAKGGVGKWLGLASRAFDVHLCETFIGWRLGLTVSTAPREVLLDNLKLALTALKITHACFVPSLLDQAGIEPHHVPDLVYFSVGGEKVSKQVLDTWANQDNTLVVNAYGPTEMTIGCSASRITSKSNARNIGRPFGNTGAHVLLAGTYNYAKRGQSGEMCFTGDLVGNGYYERPDAAGFISDFHGQRMYRTGDIVRMMADGSLEYLGRSDDQTKIRGQRIELGEVSESIRTSSTEPVDVATLIVRHPDLANNLLVSFVSYSSERLMRYGVHPSLVQKDFHVFGQQVQAECRKHLPAYMVPDYVILVDVVPLAQVSGKADAKTLRAFLSSIPLSVLLGSSKGSGPTTRVSRPLTEAEEKVADSIRSIVNVKASLIHHHSNIFQLGIDSLKVVGLSIQLRRLGFAASVASILSHPSIQELAMLPKIGTLTDPTEHTELVKKLSEFESDVYKKATFKLSTNLIQKIRPCLPLQEGIVARTLNSESNDLYIHNLLLELDKKLDLPRFEKAWCDVAVDAVILRTCFVQVGDSFVQTVLKPNAIPIPWTEFLVADNLDAIQLLKVEQKNAQHNIVEFLETLPPIRLHLVTSKSGSPLLSISIHHALYDGISFNMILNEVYLKYCRKPPGIRASFDVLLRYIASQDQLKQKAFWTKRLSGYLKTEVASRLVEDTQPNTVERTVRLAFSELQALSASLKATVPTLLQTIYGVLLARTVGQSDILFGSVLSGRTGTIDGAETILAPCITTVPQRIRFNSGSTPLSVIVTDLQQSNIELLEFQHTSLRQINRWVGAEKPLFDSLFSYIQSTEPPIYKGLWRELESTMAPDYPFAIEFEADEETDRLTTRVTFTPSFGPQEKAYTILEQIDLLLTALNNDEKIMVDSLQILDKKKIRGTSTDIVWDESSWMPKEELMRNIAATFCNLDRSLLTKNTSFFRLGIDSITAIRFSRSLREAHIKANSSDILRHPCIGALWNHISTKQQDPVEISVKPKNLDGGTQKPVSSLQSLNDENTEITYSCTPLQTGMITATLISGGSLYVHHHAVRLHPQVNNPKMKKAWATLVQSNDILRTTFHTIAEGENPWIACVKKSQKVRWFEVTSEKSSDDFIEDISKRMIYQNEIDFKEPPIQVHVLQTPMESILIISMHHALYDGLSIPMIFSELAQLYKSGIPTNRLSYHTVARSLCSGEAESVEFWLRNVRDYLPLGKPRILPGKTHGVIHIEKRASAMIPNVKEACKILEVTTQTLSLLAYGKIISCYLGRRDVVFGHVIAGRSLPLDGIEDVIGPLFNTVPFRLRLNQPLQSNQAMAEDIQRFTSTTLPFQHASIQLVQNAWRRESNKPDDSLFDTLFLFQNDTESSRFANDLWEPLVSPDGEITQSEYRLNLEIIETSECLTIRASCHREYMDKTQLSKVVEDFDATIMDIIDHPTRPVLAFPENLSTTPVVVEKDSLPEQHIDESSHLDEGGPLIETIRHIMSEVSGIPVGQIGPDTSIYAIGLDSIKAIRLASKCRENDLQASVADILQGVTPAKISKLISNAAHQLQTGGLEPDIGLKDNELDLSNIDKKNVEIVLPCLSGQTYHLISWLNSSRTMFEPTWAYQTEKLDSTRLEEAWAQLQVRHQILRTTYLATSACEAIQVVLKPSAVTSTRLTRIQANTDLTGVAERQIRLEARNPSNMSCTPIRLCLIQGKYSDVVLFTLHHASYDAWSMPLLISDLATIYAGLKLDPAPDFSSFIKHSIRSLHSLDQKSFWKNTLENAQSTLLKPPFSPTPSTAMPKFPLQTFLLLPSLISNLFPLTAISHTHNIPLQTLLLLAFAQLLARLTNTTNPTFGIYQLARSATFKDIHRLTGPCLNITPFSVHDPLGSSTTASVKNIQTDLAKRVPYEQSYLSEILAWVDKGVLFNTYINILFPPPESDSDPLSLANSNIHPRPSSRQPPLLTPFSVGPPTDFIPAQLIPGETAVDGLEWPLLAKEGFFLDVAIRQDGKGLDVGARAEGEGWDREKLEGFMRGFREEVEALVDGLEKKSRDSRGR
ncbi:hypothetical protein MMC14_006624 [Varicellaria rhodocarpa]|nr:hypothetical protein [Varicellaria rhodocarpa]